MDDIEESRSGHSIGIVENPLYAEEEEGQKFSNLMAKEKQAEVCIVIIIMCALLLFSIYY